MTAPNDQSGPRRRATNGSPRAGRPAAAAGSESDPFDSARRAAEALGLGPAWEALGAAGAEAADHAEGTRCVALCPICRGADLLRAGVNPELRGQLNDLQRETLLTVRTLIDHYVERLDEQPRAADRVERIPID